MKQVHPLENAQSKTENGDIHFPKYLKEKNNQKTNNQTKHFLLNLKHVCCPKMVVCMYMSPFSEIPDSVRVLRDKILSSFSRCILLFGCRLSCFITQYFRMF